MEPSYQMLQILITTISDKTNIEVNLDTTKVDTSSNTYALHMYYTGYQTFIFEGGRVQPVAY